MVRTMRLKQIDLRKSTKGSGASPCEHPDIDPNKTYLVNYDGREIIGKFSRQWYGWCFHWFWSASTLQLDSFDEVWEIVPDKKRTV